MPNSFGPNGLTIATRDEMRSTIVTAMQAIYGSDINLDPDSPDGQAIDIFVQAAQDLGDLLVEVYNSFNPDNAIGKVQDQRNAINGIQRQAGTHTVTNVTITVDRPLTLYGADQATQPIFTVADDAGVQWELQATQNPSAAGAYVYAFQAVNPGAALTVPNTITNPVSIVLGVTNINNPTTYTTLGLDEETNVAFRIRRQKSVSLASQGYLAGLFAALENIDGVTGVFIYENNTDTVNGDGVPGHSIWVIVGGSGDAGLIANAIYTKRNAGCGMFGSQSYSIEQIDGSDFTVLWDDVTPENLFIKFTATSLDGINAPNLALIRSTLPTTFVPGVNQEVNINDLATAVRLIDPNCLVTNAGFSTAATGPFTNTLSTAAKNQQFAVSAPNIIMLPMILTPGTSSVVHGQTETFVGLGGFGTLTYSISVNNSGGSINSSTGVYTAGSAGFTDTILVTDGQSNTATATVTTT